MVVDIFLNIWLSLLVICFIYKKNQYAVKNSSISVISITTVHLIDSEPLSEEIVKKIR